MSEPRPRPVPPAMIPMPAAPALLQRFLTSQPEGAILAAPLPPEVRAALPAALQQVEAALAPVAAATLAGLLQRLWDGGVPQPHPVTLGEWRRLLSPYPAAALAAAFDQVARTHRWAEPPRIADMMRWLEPEMARLQAWRRRLTTAEVRARLDARDQADSEARRQRLGRASLSPEQRALLAQLRARLAAGDSAVPLLASLISSGDRP